MTDIITRVTEASLDIDTLDDVINGGDNTDVTSRRGRVMPTLSKALKKVNDDISQQVIAELVIERERIDAIPQQRTDAINAAAAGLQDADAALGGRIDAEALARNTGDNESRTYADNNFVPNTAKGQANGVVPLDGNGKINPSFYAAAIGSQSTDKGPFDPNTQTLPTPANDGDFRVVTVAGSSTTPINETWAVNDEAHYSADFGWYKRESIPDAGLDDVRALTMVPGAAIPAYEQRLAFGKYWHNPNDVSAPDPLTEAALTAAGFVSWFGIVADLPVAVPSVAFPTINSALRYYGGQNIDPTKRVIINVASGYDATNDFLIGMPNGKMIHIIGAALTGAFPTLADHTFTGVTVAANDADYSTNKSMYEARYATACILRYSGQDGVQLNNMHIGRLENVLIISTDGGNANGINLGNRFNQVTGNGSSILTHNVIVTGFKSGSGITSTYGGAMTSTDDSLIVSYCQSNVQIQYGGTVFAKGGLVIGGVQFNVRFKQFGLVYLSDGGFIGYGVATNASFFQSGTLHISDGAIGPCGGISINMDQGGSLSAENATFDDSGNDMIRLLSGGTVNIPGATITNAGGYGIRMTGGTVVADSVINSSGAVTALTSVTGSSNGGALVQGGVLKVEKVSISNNSGTGITLDGGKVVGAVVVKDNTGNGLRHISGEAHINGSEMNGNQNAFGDIFLARYATGKVVAFDMVEGATATAFRVTNTNNSAASPVDLLNTALSKYESDMGAKLFITKAA